MKTRSLAVWTVVLVLAFASFALAQVEGESVGRVISAEIVEVPSQATPPQVVLQVALTQGYRIVPLSNGHVAVVENGAPTNWQTLRWADDVLHSNAVRVKGVAPRYIHRNFTLNPLGGRDPDGNIVDYYVTWTSGARGEVVWIRVHPGESTEMRPTAETSTYTLNGAEVTVRAWVGGWFTRCANPTRVVNWQKEAKTIVRTRTVQGPERLVPQPYPVPGPTQYIYQFAPRRDVCVPETHTIIWYERSWTEKLIPVAAAYVGRNRTTITATGGGGTNINQLASAVDVDTTAVGTGGDSTAIAGAVSGSLSQ